MGNIEIENNDEYQKVCQMGMYFPKAIDILYERGEVSSELFDYLDFGTLEMTRMYTENPKLVNEIIKAMYKKDEKLSSWTAWYVSYCLDYKLLGFPPIDLARKKIFEGIKSTKALVGVYADVIHASSICTFKEGRPSELNSMRKELLFMFKRRYTPEDEFLIDQFEQSLPNYKRITEEMRGSLREAII